MKPFRVSLAYLDWAHGPAIEDGQPMALRIDAVPSRGDYKLIDEPALVAEIADVAELYLDEPEYRLQTSRVFKRAVAWLAERGLTVKQVQRAKGAP